MIEGAIRQVQAPAAQSAVSAGRSPARSGGFGELLRQELAKQAESGPQAVAFSKHAMSRVESRGIEVTADLLVQLADSVERAQAKGATNILAMGADNAFIINVPNARVITAISQEELQQNIFTNIDGAVFLK